MKQSKKLLKKLKEDEPRFEKNIARLVKKGKGKPIKSEIFHKVKAGDRRRNIELQKLDNEIDLTPHQGVCNNPYIGEYSKDKKLKKQEAKWWILAGIFSIPTLWITLILIIDMFYGK